MCVLSGGFIPHVHAANKAKDHFPLADEVTDVSSRSFQGADRTATWIMDLSQDQRPHHMETWCGSLCDADVGINPLWQLVRHWGVKSLLS